MNAYMCQQNGLTTGRKKIKPIIHQEFWQFWGLILASRVAHISFIARKPEPLGTEFKNCLCQETEIMMMLRLCRKRTDETDELEFKI
mmetsp:Transcript_37262/g.54870  ORF Transcript_37262/g.54870 Transcript_37262/m.54870 type:complete len:87 (-) Transcript_37262:152-412(-)